MPAEISRFISAKEVQARTLADKLNLKVSKDVWSYFRTAESGNIAATTNAFERLKQRNGQYEGSRDDSSVSTPAWQPVIEVQLVVDALADCDWKRAAAFGKGVIASIPRGSIYFGGTDSGRGLVTALCKSHAEADPFFTLTQNALADERYLQYLRAMYGDKIHIPSTNESQRAFTSYLTDAQRRLEHDRKAPNEPRQIKPGEDVRIVNNRVQVSGQVAVMEINGLLAKTIFEGNPDREFYIEESFPLDWMYPNLSPHGLILKLNRTALESLPEEIVRPDRSLWEKQQLELIGEWLKPETSLKDVCEFAKRVFGRGDLSGFKGDAQFIRNDYATKLYSKLRSSIGGVYAWRFTNAKSADERTRMADEADFAFRQAFALCPRSPEAVFRYANLLLSLDRIEDALRLALTANTLEPENEQLQDLTRKIQSRRVPKK